MKKYKVLIVDGNDGIRKFLNKALNRKNFYVAEARNEKEALETIRHQSVDIILLDVDMPVMNGLEMYRHLKEKPQTENIPVIFCTASHIEEVKKMIQRRHVLTGIPGFMFANCFCKHKSRSFHHRYTPLQHGCHNIYYHP